MLSGPLDITKIDLTHWNLYVAKFSVQVDEGIQTLDVSLNSTMPNFTGYDDFLRDINLMHKIRQEAKFNPGVQEAFNQLLTVMALNDKS